MAVQIVKPDTDRYSMAELYVIAMARVMSGEEEKRGGGGANASMGLAASRLAQLTVAPDCREMDVPETAPNGAQLRKQ